ncbi:MAG: phosphate ABC transporter substrate-binding protein, partial [Pseudomonas sp.]|nr:phosphate ABC transporter substrate-binding protein [Pseudomonas sp.]
MKKMLSALALLSCAALAQAEVAVIVNAGASAAPSQADVANIFLGKDK